MSLDIRQIVGAVLLFADGLNKIIMESDQFYNLEKSVHELCQKVCSQIFTWVLEEIDSRLMNNRASSSWRVVGFRTKKAISTFGEFDFKRRLYRNKKTGEAKFFLDELLGWPERARITPRLKEMAVKLSTDLPFARAAEIINHLAPGLSTMTVWQATREVGESLQQEGKEKRAAIFEDGEAPDGKEVASQLCIEADGVMIRLQKAKEKRGEIKHIVAYEGKEQTNRECVKLKNKLVLSSLSDGEAAWEESFAAVGEKWDLSRVRRIFIGGDGANWPKQGVNYFPGAEYRLDPYHLSKHLTEALWHNGETFREVTQAISRGNLEETERILTKAAQKSRGDRKKRINRLLRYLKENWEGIVTSPGAKRLGTIEGQIQHNLARRMKRLGARWTISGGDRMARILAVKANGRLGNYVLCWPIHRKLREIAQTEPIAEQKAKMEDIEKWLRTSVPALNGPFASKPWIKYVLREITRARSSALGY